MSKEYNITLTDAIKYVNEPFKTIINGRTYFKDNNMYLDSIHIKELCELGILDYYYTGRRFYFNLNDLKEIRNFMGYIHNKCITEYNIKVKRHNVKYYISIYISLILCFVLSISFISKEIIFLHISLIFILFSIAITTILLFLCCRQIISKREYLEKHIMWYFKNFYKKGEHYE